MNVIRCDCCEITETTTDNLVGWLGFENIVFRFNSLSNPEEFKTNILHSCPTCSEYTSFYEITNRFHAIVYKALVQSHASNS